MEPLQAITYYIVRIITASQTQLYTISKRVLNVKLSTIVSLLSI